MKLVDFSVRRRVTVSMVAVALLLFGLVAFGRLPINLLPDLSYPSLTVETRYPGAAPQEVETLVTRPVEEVVGIVSGVRRMTSSSRPGLSQVTLEFGWGRKMDFAAIDVRQKLDLLALPREASKPVLLRFNPSNDPVMRLYLSGGRDLIQMRYLAEEVLKKDLESTEGVAAIQVHGGYEEEIQVRLDQGKVALMGLSPAVIQDRLGRENVNQAGGSVYEDEARYLVRARNEFVSLEDVRNTVILSDGERRVLLGDVAEVNRGHKEREVVTRFGGQEAVELAVYKEGDANTVLVARAVHNRLERVKKELPEGIAVAVGSDQSRFIRASIREVLNNALLGGLFAILVLMLFLKDLRTTLIVGVSIPISIVATFFLMYQTGTTLNIMSLGGLALGVGMLVDNAIVVLEAIFRRREAGAGALEAARDGASEVGHAVIASTLTTVAVFVPVVFLEGIAAQLFRDTALTVSFSLLASLAVSLTLIPMMAALASAPGAPPLPHRPAPTGHLRRLLRAVFPGGPVLLLRGLRISARALGRSMAWALGPLSRRFDRGLGALQSAYPGWLGRALDLRPLVLVVALGALASTAILVPRLGLDLIPVFAQREFQVQAELPEGTPLPVTDRLIAEVQEVLAGDPRVASFSSIAGGAGLSLARTGTEGENAARIHVQLHPTTTAEDETAVAAALRSRLDALGSVRYKVERPTWFSFRTPVEVELYHDDLGVLHGAAMGVQDRLSGIQGLVDVKSSAELGNPELQVTFHRDRLAALGLDLFQVAGTLRGKIQGEVATRFLEGDREIEIRVRSLEPGRASLGEVRDLIVDQRAGVPIHLKSVADARVERGPSEIRRIGQKRAAVVSASLTGRDMASAAADIRRELAEAGLPPDVTAWLGGQQEEMSRSMTSMLLAMGLAIFLVYLVMASQFESFVHPFVILFTLPLGAVGAVGALALTGRSLEVVAMIGLVMLAGIVVNNAIVLVDAVNQRRRAGLARREAILEAGQSRLRPILMTSATTILGLLPMALGLGEGAELRAPLAVTVIGGLAAATVLTLIVIPVVYSLLDRKADAALVTGVARAARTERPETTRVSGPSGVEALP
jgi:hydrophobic/amphiphilic exporter-1 (mainly G- bacteria), HAE1 family